MTNQENVNFFTTRTFELLRQLSPGEQRQYLAGLLALTGDILVVHPLRFHLNMLLELDAQAELFATGLRHLNLDAE